MSDARTKIDILYQMVLGDVTELVDKVEGLQNTLPGITQEIESTTANAIGRLNMQVALLSEAGTRYEKLITALVEESKRNIIKAAEAAKRSELRDLEEEMAGLAGKALNAAVASKFNPQLGVVTKEIALLSAGIQRTQLMLKWSIIGAVSATLTGLIVFAAAKWYTGQNEPPTPPAMTQEQQRLIAIGSGVERAWGTLDPKAKKLIESQLTAK